MENNMNRIKYPRTMHLPWSLGVGSDDKIITSLDCLSNNEVVVTEKLDGENTTMTAEYIHARSVDSGNHTSRDWVKQFHSTIAHDIPKNYRICGENVYAKHSIFYDSLESYFYGFSVWDEYTCLSWDDTIEIFELLGITSVPVLYRGVFDKNIFDKLDLTGKEGYVVRVCDSFDYYDFSKKVAKWVRKDHVQTDKHWTTQKITLNVLRGNNL